MNRNISLKTIKSRTLTFLMALALLVPATSCGRKEAPEPDTDISGITTQVMAQNGATDEPELTEHNNIGTSTEAPDQTETNENGENMIYVALGDSLTHGYGLTDKQKDRFSAVIADRLREAGIRCSEFNYGVDGLTSSGLLEMLNSGQCSMTGRAGLITIDIGANDVLHVLSALAGYAMYGITVSEQEYEQVQTELAGSLEEFRGNFGALIDKIKDINLEAEIVCTTIYNPYRDINMTIQTANDQVELSEYTDTVVTELNSVIKEVAADKGIELADSYGAFELTNKKVLNAKNDDTGVNMDIHPNKDGYALMAEAFYQVIKNNYE